MFAPKVAKPENAAKSSTGKPTLQPPTLAGRRLGHDPIEQILILQRSIGNQATLRLLAQQAPPRATPSLPQTPRAAENKNSTSDEGATIGAIVGGVLGAVGGFLLGGPVGALVGGVLGGVAGAAVGSAIGATGAGKPGNQRSVNLQPVVFRNDASDPTPTGGSWARRLGPSNTIWGKLGVTFNDAAPVTIDNSALKTAGSNRGERDSIRAAHSDASKVCVFLTDNDLADVGGGGTVGGGAAGAKIALSDRGTSNTLLAHELGHALGLGHPPGGADNNTIMTPTGGNNSDNPTRNTIGNFNRITWPAPGAPVTIHPDP